MSLSTTVGKVFAGFLCPVLIKFMAVMVDEKSRNACVLTSNTDEAGLAQFFWCPRSPLSTRSVASEQRLLSICTSDMEAWVGHGEVGVIRVDVSEVSQQNLDLVSEQQKWPSSLTPPPPPHHQTGRVANGGRGGGGGEGRYQKDKPPCSFCLGLLFVIPSRFQEPTFSSTWPHLSDGLSPPSTGCV